VSRAKVRKGLPRNLGDPRRSIGRAGLEGVSPETSRPAKTLPFGDGRRDETNRRGPVVRRRGGNEVQSEDGRES
jgi:hypothetical protein